MRRLSALIPKPETLVLAYFFISLFRPIFDPDTFLHLATGQLVWDGHIPKVDPFSHPVAGKQWIAHEWLAAALLQGIYRLGGLGLIGWAVPLTGGILLILFLKLYDDAGVISPLARGISLAIAVNFVSSSVHARPHLLTFLFLAISTLLLNRFRSTGRIFPLLCLPPIFAIWVNCHGGYILGAIPIMAALVHGSLEIRGGAPGAETRFRWLLATIIACALACCINPQGSEMLLFPFSFRPGMRYLRVIQEWQYPTLVNAAVRWELLIAFVAITCRWPTHTPAELFTIFVVLFLSLQAVRNLFLVAIFGTPLLAKSLQQAFSGDNAAGRVDRWIAILNPRLGAIPVYILLAIGSLPWALNHEFVDPRWFPTAAAAWIKRHHPPQNMYNSYNSGGYLIWALHGHYPVFVDGRLDLYERHGKFRDYTIISDLLPGWDSKLDEYRINFAIDRLGSNLLTALGSRPDWRLAYADHSFGVLLRVPPLPAPVTGR